jgi:hypothetical protein
VAKSAPNPAQPVSHLGNTVKPFYLELSSIEPELSGNPQGDFRFAVSYGDPQTVQVLAARSLGAVTLKYQINGGATQSKPTSEWNGGERFGAPGDVYYHVVRGQVTGTQPGNSVKVWFEGGGKVSDSFTYVAKVESSARVLVLAAEDYTGISPVYKKNDAPNYLSYYLDALAANGIAADVYDVDANGRKAPSALGVLDHYDAVIWYTGDDVLTREPGMAAGTASRLANDEMLAVRAYLNDGGRLLYTGKYAGFGNAFGYEFQPETNAPCNPNDQGQDGCLALSDDFLQYYLGAYVYNDEAGTSANGKLYSVTGAANPFSGLSWSFGAPSANNQDHSASFIATSGILPAATYPQFTSSGSAKYVRPGGPFDPHTGQYYAYSQIADITYKRLTRTIDLTSQPSGNLSFWISRDTEQDWDFVFVEAHTVGQDNWTTLPDQNGHTSQSTGPQDPDLASCPAGWRELHPRAQPGSGMQPRVDRTAGSSGRSIFPPMQASRSRSRSPMSAIGRCRGWARLSTTRPSPPGHQRRSRPTWVAGQWLAPRQAALRTGTTLFARPRPASRRAPRSRPRIRSTLASASRASRRLVRGRRS